MLPNYITELPQILEEERREEEGGRRVGPRALGSCQPGSVEPVYEVR